MKVLHVLDTSIPKISGYTTRAYYLTKHMKAMGCEPLVLTSERYGDAAGIMKEKIDGIHYYRTPRTTSLWSKVPLVRNFAEVRNLEKRVEEVARREKVQLIHAHSPSLTGAACLHYCKATGIPLVYEIRAFWEDAAVDRCVFREGGLHYNLRKLHETRLVKKVDSVITICQGLKDDLLNRGIDKERIEVVPNGVDCQEFVPVQPDMSLKKELGCEGNIIIGFIGTFFNFEGLQLMVEAMTDIAHQLPEIKLLLVGGGQVDEELRRMVWEKRLGDRVVFIGRVPHNLVSRYYSIIDLLVYPRVRRRITELVTPLKPLEAMAMEKAVLMSDVGGLRELVKEEGVAAFFKAEDNKDLVEKCVRLCLNDSERQSLAKHARNYVGQFWDWASRAESDINLYEKLLRRKLG